MSNFNVGVLGAAPNLEHPYCFGTSIYVGVVYYAYLAQNIVQVANIFFCILCRVHYLFNIQLPNVTFLGFHFATELSVN